MSKIGLYSPGWNAPRCKTCRFWTSEDAGIARNTDAECRRLPPAPITGVSQYGHVEVSVAWPATDEKDWCGEHKAMPRRGRSA